MLAVLDYGIGNLRSAQKALQHVGADARLVTDPAMVGEADGVVLPGVGAFGRCAEALRASGLDEAARRAIAAGRPFLGICVGFQLLYDRSEETPDVPGLGVLPGTVRSLSEAVKRPQMQWNQLRRWPQLAGAGGAAVDPASGGAGRGTDRSGDGAGGAGAALLAGLPEDAWVYFVHSFAPDVTSDTVAVCDYGGPVAAAAVRGRVWGTQFHPEKSGRTGLGVLGNFVRAVAGA